MATDAFLIYSTPADELRGVRIGHMGGRVPEQLQERFGQDYDAIAAFIEIGYNRGGYSYATDAEPRWNADDLDENPVVEMRNAEDHDYVFLLKPSGEIVSGRVVPTFVFQEA